MNGKLTGWQWGRRMLLRLRQGEARWSRATAAFAMSLIVHAALILLAILGRLQTEQARLSQAATLAAPGNDAAARSGMVFTVVDPGATAPAREPSPAAAGGQSVPTASDPSAAPVPTPSLGADWLPVDGTRFIPVSQLTRSPQIYEAPTFDLPELKTASGGKIRMALWVDREGRVVAVEIQQAPPGNAIAANAIAKMLRLSAFIPGLLNGERVGSIVNVEIELDPAPAPHTGPPPPAASPPP